jgi:nitrite reductase/ring-hydroxylating ferredoxin subunit
LTPTSTAIYLAKKRGKRLDRELLEPSDASSSRMANRKDLNWRPLPASVSDPSNALPSQMDKVSLLETRLPELTNPATNPSGVVAVVRHGAKTYCFDSSCPSCKIPLTKATVTERQLQQTSQTTGAATVVLSCDFCSAAYDLASGARVESSTQKRGGIFSGVVSSVMAADPRSAGPLRLYRLSQQGGKLMIAID